MIRTCIVLAVLLGVGPSPVHAVSVDWADAFEAAGRVDNPGNVLGPPDNEAANVWPPLGSLTVSFTGSASGYDADGLAALLGVSPALLGSADVIAFDRNPNPQGFVGFEDSFWHFDDGASTFDFYWDAGSPAGGVVIGVGSVDRIPYAAFFGLTPLSFDADFGFLLFDLDGVGLVARSADFRVTLSADPASTIPDPDAIGRLLPAPVPEPSSLALTLACGLWVVSRRLRYR